MTKGLEFSIGNNKPCKLTLDTAFVYLEHNANKLVEVEVKSDSKNLGWVYNDEIEFVILGRDVDSVITTIKALRKLVEENAKKHGKVYSDTPKLYHIRKDEHGGAYYYLHQNDIKDA